jgi:hypothetical protein
MQNNERKTLMDAERLVLNPSELDMAAIDRVVSDARCARSADLARLIVTSAVRAWRTVQATFAPAFGQHRRMVPHG